MNEQCVMCGEYMTKGRWELGYHTCLLCGEEVAKQKRAHWCVAPMHKSNYMLITDLHDLAGLNNKGGLVR